MKLTRFLDALGDLHDARLERLEWLPEKGAIALRFTDLMSAFVGLERYAGPQPGVIVLSGISRCLIEIPTSLEMPRVYSFECRAGDQESTLVARISLWPSGIVEIVHTAADFPEEMAARAEGG